MEHPIVMIVLQETPRDLCSATDSKMHTTLCNVIHCHSCTVYHHPFYWFYWECQKCVRAPTRDKHCFNDMDATRSNVIGHPPNPLPPPKPPKMYWCILHCGFLPARYFFISLPSGNHIWLENGIVMRFMSLRRFWCGILLDDKKHMEVSINGGIPKWLVYFM